MINVFQPSLGEEELEAVRGVFASNWVGRGKLTDRFERQFAAHLDVDPSHMRSIGCATEGLFQAMTLLGLGAGDEVVLPSLSFVGAANAVAASGARPVFCDVDRRTLNPTAGHIAASLSPRTRAVLLLHYGGAPCEMDAIADLLGDRDLHGSEQGVALIEDSACSVASTYKGRACGTLGDIGVWSFDAMKILVTGDGGMVYCRDPLLAARLESQIYLGLEQQSGFASATSSSPAYPSSPAHERWWQFELAGFGRRAIMNDIAAAIGLEQIQKLPTFIARRKAVHEAYDRGLAGLDWLLTPPPLPPTSTSSYYFYWIQCQDGARDALAHHLRDHDIYTTFRYYPLHYVKRYHCAPHLPNTDHAAETTLCLPIHQGLSDDDVDRVIECIREFRV